MGAPIYINKEERLDFIEKNLPKILSYYRKAKKGRAPTYLFLDGRRLERRDIETLLMMYYSRLTDKFDLSRIKPRRIKKLVSVYRNDYDYIVFLSPDRRSKAVASGELTLTARIDIRKLPFAKKLERVRKRIVETIQNILTEQARRWEAIVRKRAAHRLLNLLAEKIYDKPRRKLSAEEKRTIIRIARKDIHERHMYRPGIYHAVRITTFAPRRVRHLREILNKARKEEDLYWVLSDLLHFLKKRYRLPKGVRERVLYIIDMISAHYRDPYYFLMENIVESLEKMNFYVHRIGPYATVARPWPSPSIKNPSIRDIHRFFLRVRATNVKIYIRTTHWFAEAAVEKVRLETLPEGVIRPRTPRDSPYAKYPVYHDESGKPRVLRPRNDREAVIRIEINVPTRYTRNRVFLYIYRLLLLLIANIVLGLGPRTTDMIDDILYRVLLAGNLPGIINMIYGTHGYALIHYYTHITKWWLPDPG